MTGKWITSQPKLQIRILQRIKRRYALAIGLLAVSTIVSFFLESHANSLKASDYELINLAGRQRMLSQRLALISVTDASLFSGSFDRRAQISDVIYEIQYGLQKILQSRFVIDDPSISNFYSRQDGVKDFTERLITLAQKNTGELNAKVVDLAYYNLIPLLDEATHRLQVRSEEDFKMRKKVALAAFFLTLTVLLLEVLFIFQPLVNEVRNSLDEVERMHVRALAHAQLSAMGELTAIVGHELSNSLAIMKPTLNMLSEKWKTASPEKIERHLHRLVIQTESMERILSTLKYQARGSNYDPVVEVDLKKVVQESAHFLRERFKSNDIDLRLIQDPRPLVIKAKAGELYQVMNNLISNAIDSVALHRNPAGNWVHIELGYFPEVSGGYFIRISDSGPGVPSELSEKIFDTFFTTKGERGGTGLGLTVSKRIIEGLGGKLFLNTEQSQSWFEIQLPAPDRVPASGAKEM